MSAVSQSKISSPEQAVLVVVVVVDDVGAGTRTVRRKRTRDVAQNKDDIVFVGYYVIRGGARLNHSCSLR